MALSGLRSIQRGFSIMVLPVLHKIGLGRLGKIIEHQRCPLYGRQAASLVRVEGWAGGAAKKWRCFGALKSRRHAMKVRSPTAVPHRPPADHAAIRDDAAPWTP